MPFPYYFPFLFDDINSVSYVIEVDWDNDGDFDEAYEDITADVKEVTGSYGKDDELGDAQVGRVTIVTKGGTALKYSPENSSGVLYGNLLPKRKVRIRFTGGWTLWSGFLEDIVPHPHWSEKDATLTAVDGLDRQARQELDTVLWKNQLTGTLVGNILDVSSWPAADRAIDAGQDTVPYAYWSKVTVKTALGDMEETEQGFVYINRDGQVAFEDRHHRFSAEHQTSKTTLNDTMVGLSYLSGPKKIYNEVRVTVTPWTLQSIAELWRLSEVPVIQVGETLTWWGDASVAGVSVFVDAWTTPAATTDYTANTQADGLGTDKTANVSISVTKFAQTIKIMVTNNATVPVYMTLLKARGTYYDDNTKVTRKAEDTASQNTYDKRTLPVDGKFITDAAKGQDYADYAVGRYKDPQAEISVQLLAKNHSLLNEILARTLSDRVTLINSNLGLSKDYFIDKVEFSITENMKVLRASWVVSDATNEDFWCLDYSALGTGTKVGY